MDRKTLVAFFLVVAFLAATPLSTLAAKDYSPRQELEDTVKCLRGEGPCDQKVLDFLAKFAGKPGRPGRDGNTPTAAELVAILKAAIERGDLKLPAGQVDEARLREIVSRILPEELKKLQTQPEAAPGPAVVPPVPSREISLPDWLWWLLIAALILALLWWLTRRRIRNDGRFYIGRYRFARRRAEAVLSRGPALEADKRVVNLTRTPPAERRWAQRVTGGYGDVLQFRLEWRNTGYTPVPANRIRLQDALEGPGEREGNMILNVGGGPDIVLAETQVAALFGGGLTLADVPGAPMELAPRTPVYVRYRVRVDLPGDGEGAEAAGPPPAN